MQMPVEARIEESVPVNAASDKERESEGERVVSLASLGRERESRGVYGTAGVQGPKEATRREDWTLPVVIITEGGN